MLCLNHIVWSTHVPQQKPLLALENDPCLMCFVFSWCSVLIIILLLCVYIRPTSFARKPKIVFTTQSAVSAPVDYPNFLNRYSRKTRLKHIVREVTVTVCAFQLMCSEPRLLSPKNFLERLKLAAVSHPQYCYSLEEVRDILFEITYGQIRKKRKVVCEQSAPI